jgi:hypothetical protein
MLPSCSWSTCPCTGWHADEASGRAYFSLAQGAVDVSQRWVVSHRWEDWKHEVGWMSLHFSVAVWLSIGFIHAPVLRRRLGVLDGSPCLITVERLHAPVVT